MIMLLLVVVCFHTLSKVSGNACIMELVLFRVGKNNSSAEGYCSNLGGYLAKLDERSELDMFYNLEPNLDVSRWPQLVS